MVSIREAKKTVRIAKKERKPRGRDRGSQNETVSHIGGSGHLLIVAESRGLVLGIGRVA